MTSVLIADGGPEKGAGHWVRMLALAHVLPDPILVTPQWNGEARPPTAWDKPPCPVEIVDTMWDVADFAKSADIAVFDTFEAANNFHGWHGPTFATVDDMGDAIVAGADYVINPAVGAERLTYKTDATKLLGAKYALLRPEFAQMRTERDYDRCETLVICTGGGNSWKPYEEWLKSLTQSFPGEVVWFGRVPNYEAAIHTLARADLAISTASTTVLELLCLGIPTLTFACSPNQEVVQEGLLRVHATVPLNATNFEAMQEHPINRASHGVCGMGLVDGLGAQRVAQHLTGKTLRL